MVEAAFRELDCIISKNVQYTTSSTHDADEIYFMRPVYSLCVTISYFTAHVMVLFEAVRKCYVLLCFMDISLN